MMMHARLLRLFILLIALLLAPAGAGAQNETPSANIIVPVHGQLVFPNLIGSPDPADLIVVDTYTGATTVLVENDSQLEGPVWSPMGEYLAYHRGPAVGNDNRNEILHLPSGTIQNIAALQDPNTIPVGWSQDGNNIVYADFSLDQTTYISSYTFKLYSITSDMVSSIQTFESLQVLTGLPRPVDVGDFTFFARDVYQMTRNPVHDQWVAWLAQGLDTAIVPDRLNYEGEIPQEAYLYDVILWNFVTGQFLSVDALLSETVNTSRAIAWSDDGRYFFLDAGVYLYILTLQEVNGTWQLDIVTNAEQISQSPIDWLGVNDIIITGSGDDATGETIYHLAQIINGVYQSTEFIHFPPEINVSGASGDWRLTASEEEQWALSCLFDQALPTRLATGVQAKVVGSTLDLWPEPKLEGTPIAQLPADTIVTISGQSACFNGEDYSRLWQVELSGGGSGWLVEADMQQITLEPVQ